MNQPLLNKTAVVTGGTRGIGRAIALTLASAGARVLICGTSQSGVKEAQDRLRAESKVAPENISGQVADVSKFSEVERLFASASNMFAGKLDVLVNNAGLGIFKPVAELTPEEWHRVIDLNLSGLYYCCHVAYPLLRAAGNGYVFNISSLAGKNPFAGGAAYNASKFGVNGFGEAMMLDHRQEGIRVTSVMPGSVNTEFGSVPGQGSKTGEWKIQPQDIADVVLSLLQLPARTLVSRVEIRPSKPPVKKAE